MNQGLLAPGPGQVRLGAGGCAEVAVMKDTGARSQQEDTLLICSVSGQSLTAPQLLHHVGRGIRRGGVSVSCHLDTPQVLIDVVPGISF